MEPPQVIKRFYCIPFRQNDTACTALPDPSDRGVPPLAGIEVQFTHEARFFECCILQPGYADEIESTVSHWTEYDFLSISENLNRFLEICRGHIGDSVSHQYHALVAFLKGLFED